MTTRPSIGRPVATVFTIVISVLACAAPGPGPTSTGTDSPGPTPAPGTSTSTPSEPTSAEPSPGQTAGRTEGPTEGTTEAPVAPVPLDRLSLSLAPFAEGLESPVFVTHAGDGTGVLYAVEQVGRIATIDAAGTVGQTAFLDISEQVIAGGEQGLLGLAFHPDYPADDRFFVMYTSIDDGTNTISEFHAPGGVGDPASERVLISIVDFAGNHNGGMVAFGPDGYLYIGTGDGGGGGDPEENGQDGHALLGKIVRIDVDGEPPAGTPYAIPADNPAMTGADVAPEVWDIGLRNPWRYSFDRQTGDLWIGDVGQNQSEEIDAEPAGSGGRNYGWNEMEGDACYDATDCDRNGLERPVLTYRHTPETGCTVVGGYVYRGATEGAAGAYLFGDYCAGRIWATDAAAELDGASIEPVTLLETELTLSSFGEDEAGELYAVALDGTISRLQLTVRD